MVIPFRFHDLRHYSASIMHAIGILDQYIMARGGWKTDTVLKAVYRNVINDEQKKFTDKINKVTRENLQGINVVHAFNAEDYQNNKFDS